MWIFLSIAVVLGLYFFYKSRKVKKQKKYIQSFVFHSGLIKKMKANYPEFSDTDIQLICSGLREWFLVCHLAKGKYVAMPSKVIDEFWHEFILFTRLYELFCKNAFGRFLHHTPSEGISRQKEDRSGLKRSWKLACQIKNVPYRNPVAIPILFSLDSLLNIKGGFMYHLGYQTPKDKNDNVCDVSLIGCGSSCSNGSMESMISDFSSLDSGGSGCSSCGGGCGGD